MKHSYKNIVYTGALLASAFAASPSLGVDATDQSERGPDAMLGRPQLPAPAPTGRWTHLGRTPWRTPWAQGPDTGPASLSSVAWTADEDDLGRDVFFLGGVGVVADDGLVCTTGFAGGEPVALAFAAGDGVCAWSAPIPEPAFSSWSTPAIDKANGTLLVAAGNQLRALGLGDGVLRWAATLEHPVVNASPLVTTDRGPRDRAFITDYSLADLGAPGRLYCINVDPFDTGANPHEPGDIVWAAPLAPGEVGASPACDGRRVYLATSAGRLLAYPIDSATTPAPLWSAPNTSGDAFFGGVSVFAGDVYAASYNFGIGQLSGELVKIDAVSGELRWSVPSNRTDSIPVPLGGGLIAVSGGVPPDPFFFDHRSAPSLALFMDLGANAVMLWDSALDTWADDGDGVIENGEFLSVGGWTHVPALVRTPDGPRLLVGSMDEEDYGGVLLLPGVETRLIDPMRSPADPMFITDTVVGLGGSPAVVGDALYSIGPGGLVCLRAPDGPEGDGVRRRP